MLACLKSNAIELKTKLQRSREALAVHRELDIACYPTFLGVMFLMNIETNIQRAIRIKRDCGVVRECCGHKASRLFANSSVSSPRTLGGGPELCGFRIQEAVKKDGYVIPHTDTSREWLDFF